MAFLYIVVLVRLFGPEGAGTYSYVTTTMILLTTILGVNFKHTVAYYLASRKIAKDKLYTISLFFPLIILGVFGLGVVLLYFFGQQMSERILPSEIRVLPVLVYSIIYFLTQLIIIVIEGILIGLTRFDKINKIELLVQILRVVIFSMLFLLQYLGLLSFSTVDIFVWLFAVEVMVLSIYLSNFFQSVKLEFDFKMNYRKEISEMRRFALQGYFINNATYITKRLDVWFIEFYNGFASLGHYSLATQMTNFILEFVFPIRKVLLPYLTKMKDGSGQRLFFIATSGSFVFVLICAIVLTFLAPFVIPFLFGKAFLFSVLPTQILSFAVLMIFVRNNIKMFNKAYDRQIFSIHCSIIELLAIVILDIALIPRYGIKGAAVATLLAYCASTSYIVWSARKELEQPIFRLFVPRPTDLKLIVAKIKAIVKKKNV